MLPGSIMASPSSNTMVSAQRQQELPSFEDHFDKNGYQQPALRSLVSFKWGEEGIYRVGVLLKKGKKWQNMRFFNGYEGGKHFHKDLVFEYTPERFRDHLCLARVDLVEER